MERVVERIAERICKRPANDLHDLAQTVYISLLQMEPDKLRSLAEGGLNFYIVGMVRKQAVGRYETFYKECVDFAARTIAIGEKAKED